MNKPKFKVRRNSNGAAAPIAKRGLVLDVFEMAALDDLGPLCRRAICECALPTLASSIVAQVIELNEAIEKINEQRAALGQPQRRYIDPKDPELDRRFAVGVVENNFKLLYDDLTGKAELVDRAQDWATMGIKPLIARPSGKTMRERRKTEGRRFRGW